MNRRRWSTGYKISRKRLPYPSSSQLFSNIQAFITNKHITGRTALIGNYIARQQKTKPSVPHTCTTPTHCAGCIILYPISVKLYLIPQFFHHSIPYIRCTTSMSSSFYPSSCIPSPCASYPYPYMYAPLSSLLKKAASAAHSFRFISTCGTCSSICTVPHTT